MRAAKAKRGVPKNLCSPEAGQKDVQSQSYTHGALKARRPHKGLYELKIVYTRSLMSVLYRYKLKTLRPASLRDFKGHQSAAETVDVHSHG